MVLVFHYQRSHINMNLFLSSFGYDREASADFRVDAPGGFVSVDIFCVY